MLAAVLPLLFILGTLLLKGAGSLSLDFFTRMPAPAGENGGGVANAIVGTLLMVGTACLIGIPVGIGAGVFASEYPGQPAGDPLPVRGRRPQRHAVDRHRRLRLDLGRGAAEALLRFAGSVALAILMVPMVMRTTEEIIKLVPHSLREAALALGYQRWRTTLQIVLLTALPGILTGALLAVARIAGETAPLLFTALGSQYMGTNLNQPMASLPLTVYTYATGPYEEWHRYAWAAALVLILMVFILAMLCWCCCCCNDYRLR